MDGVLIFTTDHELIPPSETPDRLLLDAARNDNVDQLEDLFEEHEGKFDINFQDG
jgi:hypothetical protein